MLVVLAGLGISLLLLGREPAIAELEPIPEEYIFIAADSENEIKYITVLNSHGEYTIRAGDNPVIIGYENFPINFFNFFHILNASWRLSSWGLITDDTTNLPDFGLDPPQAQVFIQTVNGQTVTLLVGSSAPGGNIYVKLQDNRQIHLASFFDAGIFLRSFYELMDTAITPGIQRNHEGMFIFDRIILGGEVREAITIVNSDPTHTIQAYVISPCQIISPVNAAVSIEQVHLLESLFGLHGDKVVGRSEELVYFGLAQPWSTAEVFTAAGNFRVLVSKPDNTGMVFIHRQGSPLIYETYDFNLPWLEVSYFDLMNRMVHLPFIDNVASVEIKAQERTVSFFLSGEGNAMTVRAGTIDIDPRNFRVFYQNLVSARFDEYAGIPAALLPPPFLEIVYHYRDSSRSSDTVSFHEASGRRVLTSLNRGRAHFTLITFTDRILSDLELVLTGQPVRSYL
jgi:hypothetical protein